MYASEFMDLSLNIRCRFAASLLKHFWLKLYAVETTVDGEPFTALIADDGFVLEYFKEKFSPGETTISRKGVVNALRAPNLIRNDVDLIIVGANQLLAGLYPERGFYIIPRWVRLFLPVTEEPFSRIYSLGRQARKYFKWMIKKTEDAGFECEITRDLSLFQHFYYEMYKPYALYRFGERAVVYKYRIVEKAFECGALGLVRKNGKPVAGTVIEKQGNNLHLPHTGAAMDSLEALKDGAAFALDYHLVNYAYSEGYQYVNFGHSRPFFSDGTLRYKMNWHMDVLPDNDSAGVYAVATPNNTPQASKWLSANPHFYLTEEGCRSSVEQPPLAGLPVCATECTE